MPTSNYTKIEKAIHYLVKNSSRHPSLRDLSQTMSVGESHLHRVFRQWAGITPKDFLQVLALTKAKKLLSRGVTVLDTSLEVGYSGASRLYDLFVSIEAMTPGEYKLAGLGLTIEWDIFASPMGEVILGATERGICALNFTDGLVASKALEAFQKRWPKAEFKRSPSRLKKIEIEICHRMKGNTKGQLQILLGGTPFQVKVWQALLTIPEGSITTYQSIAEAIEKPKAVRAVGTAIGSNPISYLIPCHRVIQSTGAVGNYHWGSDRKVALLSAELGRS